ncbi:SMP-30/gluconolactonase/LRE family protein [Halorarius litoreus]|uniref:SMP-30/gluconolactonase/LRE family protein n=1 Tax=Halorarius litoreus TaxID=2962676 RepID=UPI0020CEADE3|nr:SMP-30/gluconolactonase/LRE family protein [Halorarius litoreus]
MGLRRLRRPLAAAGLLLGAAATVALRNADSRLDPVSWRPPESPDLSGPLAENRALTDCDHVLTAEGPEDVAFDADGRLYTGAENGTVYRTTEPVTRDTVNADLEPVADTGGRPLALEFAGDDLLVCVAEVGLVSVAQDGTVTELATEVGGRDVVFADDLYIEDGVVYFTDASKHPVFQDELFELQDTGRLLAYDRETGETRILLKGLGFANGIALGPDDESLLITETSRYRITRFWHRGELEGRVERWTENLVGYPDNVDRDPDGNYWVAIPSLRDPMLERLHRYPGLKRQLGKFPEAVIEQVSGDPYGLVLKLDADGEVTDSLHDPTGRVHGVTSATPHEGALYLGSLFGDHVTRYPLDG